MPVMELKVNICALSGTGEEDVLAAARPTVHLAIGGVAVRTKIKGGATAPAGPAAVTRGNSLHYSFCTH